MALATGLALGTAAVTGALVGRGCGDAGRRVERSFGKVVDLLQALAASDSGEPAPSEGGPAAYAGGEQRRGSKERRGSKGSSRPAGNCQEGFDNEPDDVVQRHGFSMDEARHHIDAMQTVAMTRAPREVLQELQRGNARFFMNRATRPEISAFERRGLISKQFPSVAILGCSDSRVPVEIVFDQGLGDIFVIRVAGNCLDTSTLASVQYAVHALKVKVLLVLGHEMCGAVKAAMQPQAKLEEQPAALEQALKSIKVGLDGDLLASIKDPRAQDREAVSSNVRHQLNRLAMDSGIMGKVRNSELIIAGAFYELSSGIVDVFDEVTP